MNLILLRYCHDFFGLLVVHGDQIPTLSCLFFEVHVHLHLPLEGRNFQRSQDNLEGNQQYHSRGKCCPKKGVLAWGSCGRLGVVPQLLGQLLLEKQKSEFGRRKDWYCRRRKWKGERCENPIHLLGCANSKKRGQDSSRKVVVGSNHGGEGAGSMLW